jgi:hypothetical protein
MRAGYFYHASLAGNSTLLEGQIEQVHNSNIEAWPLAVRARTLTAKCHNTAFFSSKVKSIRYECRCM